MKKFYLLICFIISLLHSPLLAQEIAAINEFEIGTTQGTMIERRKEKPENLWGIDFHLISISGHYARRFANGFYIGLELGILPEYYWMILAEEHFTKENTIWSSNREYEHFNNCGQLYFGHLFLRWRPNEIPLELDGGFRAAKYWRNVLFNEDDWGWTNFYGAYVKPMFRVWKFSIGARLVVGNMNSHSFKPSPEFVIIATPVLRFNFIE